MSVILNVNLRELTVFNQLMLTLPTSFPDKVKKKLKFLFSYFFVVPQRFYEGLKGLHKTL